MRVLSKGLWLKLSLLIRLPDVGHEDSRQKARNILEKSGVTAGIDVDLLQSLEVERRKQMAREILENSGVMAGINLIFESKWFTRLWVSSCATRVMSNVEQQH